MSEEYIMDLLPEGHPVATISSEMTNVEEAARLKTAPGIIATLIEEAERALAGENGGPTLAAILGQANTYLNVIEERAPEILGEGEQWLHPYFKEPQDLGLIMLEEAIDRHHPLLKEALRQDVRWGEETEIGIRTAAAYILALSGALEEHTKGMAAKDDLQDGHRQAALGIHANLESLAHFLDEDADQPGDTGLPARAARAMDSADAALHAEQQTLADLTTTRFHSSFDEDPETRREAVELARDTINSMQSTGLVIDAGEKADPRETIQSFYHAGILHVKRMSDEYPKGVPRAHAKAIANQIIMGVSAHAQDHAEEWGDTLIAFAENMAAEAQSGIHTSSAQSIDRMLETLLEITGHPGSLKAAIRIMLGQSQTARDHLKRRKELVQVASPEQAEAIMDTARSAGLTPGQLHYLQAFINGDTGRNMLPDGAQSIKDTIRVLEAAKEVSTSTYKLTVLADMMKTWDHEEEIMDWIVNNAVDEDDDDEDD